MDQAAAALTIISKFFQQPINLKTLRHNLSKNQSEHFNSQDILLGAKEISLKAKVKKIDVNKINEKALPAIIFNESNDYWIIAKVSEDQALIQNPSEQKPRAITLEKLKEKGFEKAIYFKKANPVLDETTKFGFSWFFQALKKYKKYVMDIIIASFFIQILALATPIFFQTVIDKVIVHNGISTLNVLAIGFIVVTLVDFCLNILRTYVQNHTANRLDVTLGSNLFKHLVNLPINYFDSRKVGHTVARVKELENVRQFITGSTITLLIDSFFTIVFFGVMFYYSTQLALVVLFSVPFYFLIAAVVTPILRKNLDEKFQYGAENQAFLVESITGINTLKSKALEPKFSKDWDEKLAVFTNSSFAVAQIGNIGSNLTQLVSKAVTIGILWFGANAVLAGEITMGQLIAVNIFAGRVSAPILRLAQLWQDFQQIHISVNRLGEILNMPTEKKAGTNEARLPSLKGNVRFENITFGYNLNEKPIIKYLNLNIEAGKMIGIVGRSGSGKSTLTKLVQRLYLPSEGRVLIDGVDTQRADVAWLRQQIGVVLQENFLFSRSIRDNIALSDPSVSDEQIIESAKLAGAHDFIIGLPDGYNTILAEQGGGLSGGQKQRIAIARALITNPKILIFDEATSALDYESEALIQSNMEKIIKGRTVFVIAHRLSTVRNADEIIVMEKGNIVEKGTHQNLMNLENGYYKRLNDYQSNTKLEDF